MNNLSIEQLFAVNVEEKVNSFDEPNVSEGDIAIIGISARMPRADSLKQFWNNLKQGIDCVVPIPDNRRKDVEEYLHYAKKPVEDLFFEEGAYLDRIDDFDYTFFHLSPNEANMMDPNQRIFLQTAWSALEDAGYGGYSLKGSRTGVFVGFGNENEYKRMIDESFPQYASMATPGNIQPFIGSRISYMLDLKGPSMLINTTCSSSLVAVHQACQSILKGECEQAIAGGVKLNVLPIRRERIGVEAFDGKTRSFDEGTEGTGMGEGTAAMLLKPLHIAVRDRDNIYAVIKGTAVNQTGNSIGLTAPNAEAQKEVILQAWKKAGIDPSTIQYWEAHGSGTRLGDPIEIEAIRRAFVSQNIFKKQFCALGSVKTNIGHLDNMAGMAGLIKAAMVIKEGLIPPNLHFELPNKQIRFTETPLYLNTELSSWPSKDYPRRCGVSSFGISGTNCHIVLEEGPTMHSAPNIQEERKTVSVFTVSAENEQVLKELLTRYKDYLTKPADLKSVCYTANMGRGHYRYRLALIARDINELGRKLDRVSTVFEHDPANGIFLGNPTTKESQKKDAKLDIVNIKTSLFAQQVSTQSLLDVNSLCQQYVEGFRVPWDEIYKNMEIAKVSLPTYPFQQHRCWLPISSLVEANDRVDLLVPRWIPEKFDSGSHFESNLKDGNILIFKDKHGFSDRLIDYYKVKGVGIIEVEVGTKFVQHSEKSFIVAADNESTGNLFERIKNLDIHTIIHMSALNLNGLDLEDRQQQQLELMRNGGMSFYYFCKHLMQYKFSNSIDIYIISNYGYEVTRTEPYLVPENAFLYGLGKTVRLESPLRCRTIDVDHLITDEHIINEINQPFSVYSVAYRHGQRYVECWQEYCEDSYSKERLRLDSEGVYIVAGGSGGIGLEILLDLSSDSSSTFAILGTAGLPKRDEWDEILEKGNDTVLCKKINLIQQVEINGSKTAFYQVDLADSLNLGKVLNEIRSRLGPIKGVIHSAGKPGNGYLLNKTDQSFQSVIDPKVAGTWNLHEQTCEDHMDFFILFSSVTSLSGEPGQVDYTAANHFQDVFSDYRNRTHPHQRTVSINWSAWKGTGMAVKHHDDRTSGVFQELTVEEAKRSFHKILSTSIPRVAVGKVQPGGSIYGKTVHELGIRLTESLRYKLDTQTSRTDRAILKADIIGIRNESLTKLHHKIGSVWSEVLGYTRVHVDDNFFDIGGNSILITLVYERLVSYYPNTISIADLFAYPTISKLADYITAQLTKSQPQNTIQERKNSENKDIAIIGLSGRFPYADTADSFWENLVQGMDCIRKYPPNRQTDSEAYLLFSGRAGQEIRYADGGYLNRVDGFDYSFFKLSHKEASMMDPNQRLFLQQAWQTLEDAGYGGGQLVGSNTGVFVGCIGLPIYGQLISMFEPESAPIAMAGNVTSIIASRISYLLDLKGPSLVIDTACSSSLVAIHMACQSIRNGECEQAIAGSVKYIPLPLNELSGIGIESEHYRTRTFDDASDGTAWGEGAASFLLKPLKSALKDGDHIYAVIKGGAVNQDGSSPGITVPNPISQEQLLVQAWEDAGINPETVSYLEAHGTGTKLGDPIEISAISKAFSRYTIKKQFCAIGSVKTNIGHLDHCSGAAGMVKAILALKHKTIPASLHFQRPNRNINFSESAVYYADRTTPWISNEPLRCGVSSFGLSGTNCHLVLEEAPKRVEKVIEARSFEVFTISASTTSSFQEMLKDHIRYLQMNPTMELRSICYTANTGRGQHKVRAAFVIRQLDELLRHLNHFLLRAPYTNKGDGVFYNDLSNGNHITEEVLRPERITDETTTLSQLCEAYVEGYDIDWSLCYKDERLPRVSLPVYRFDQHRCWFEKRGHSLVKINEFSDQETDTSQVLVGLTKEQKQDATLQKLAAIWHELLHVESIGLDDNFFDLGGDSIIVMVLSAQIAKELGCKVQVSQLFEAPSIREQLSLINEDHEVHNVSKLPLMKKSANRSHYPLTSAQQRIYIVSALTENKTLYNETHAYEVRGNFNKERLEQAFHQLIKRHDSFRTGFGTKEGKLASFIKPNVKFSLSSAHVRNEDIHDAIKEFIRPFELDKPPLLRAQLLQIDRDKQILLFDTHHIIIDGRSMELLARELKVLYEGEELPLLSYQYQDYAVWNNEVFLHSEAFARQETFWLKEYETYPPYLENVNLNKQVRTTGQKGAVKRFNIEQDYVKYILEKTQATPFVIGLAVLNILLGRLYKCDDITVGYPVLGRPNEEVQNIIGMFVNMLSIRNHPVEELGFLEFVEQVQRKVAVSLDHQDYPFDYLVDRLTKIYPSQKHPLFNIVLVFEHFNEEESNFHEEGQILKLIPLTNEYVNARFDLLLHVVSTLEGWKCRLIYDQSKVAEETVEKFVALYEHIFKLAASHPEYSLKRLVHEEAQQKKSAWKDTYFDL